MKTDVNTIKIISHADWTEKEIHMTDELREQILEPRDAISDMIKTRKCPEMCSNPNKCAKCDFLDSHCDPKEHKTSFWKRVFG